MEIVTAPWIIPVGIPIIRNGSIVMADGRIFDIGENRQIAARYPNLPQTAYPGLFMPGLVNCHMHLELSHLKNSFNPEYRQSFVEWIASLVEKRNSADVTREERLQLAREEIAQQYKSGVVVLCDTGNELFDDPQEWCTADIPIIMRFLEFIGPTQMACQSALKTLTALDQSVAVTGHSPYSTGADLLVEIKKRCNRYGHIFSIHTAESCDERDFIQKGLGQFRDFLLQRKSWDGMFTFEQSGFSGTVEYFHQLAILDEKTLLVHCVHVSDEEIALIGQTEAKICLCPGSNQFLGVGRPPVESMLRAGLLPCIGTDSLASNLSLDMWREIRLLALAYPNVSYSKILEMATLGGADALGLVNDYGALTVGKKANFIHVTSPSLRSCRSEDEILAELVSGGGHVEIHWIEKGYSL